MAKVKKRDKVVETKTIEIVHDPGGVTLELTNSEAQTLVEIFAVIGGNRENSRAKHTFSLLENLEEIGFSYATTSPFSPGGYALLFLDNSLPEDERE